MEIRDLSVAFSKNGIIKSFLSNYHARSIVLLSVPSGSLYDWEERMTSELTVLAYNRVGY